MAKGGGEGRTRQLYASIKEELYLAAKAKAAEMRISLKEFLERALEQSLRDSLGQRPAISGSVWKKPNLQTLLGDPLGSPISLTPEETRAIVKEAFGSRPDLPPGNEFIRKSRLRVGQLSSGSGGNG
ncbi:MAG: hypothetical protein HY666_06060 [Chloroflexi bacterium]|nr:hypothetical protein [Chloroflexota bacterium]